MHQKSELFGRRFAAVLAGAAVVAGTLVTAIPAQARPYCDGENPPPICEGRPVPGPRPAPGPHPNRCVQGYVWREARAADLVCVTPATRAQAKADNAVKDSRWVNGPYGPHTCLHGYVWREAFVGDDVCVTPSVRTQAVIDNGLAASRTMTEQ